MDISDLWARFPSEDECLNEVLKLRGISCCEGVELKRVFGRKSFYCSRCRKQYYPLKGTIFEKSTTPLNYWFYAMFLLTSTRSGTSACQLQRQIGVTYKTAWRMFRQIRRLMVDKERTRLSGIVEVDEAYVGGRRKNPFKLHWNGISKETLFGAVERKGRVIISHVPNNGKLTLIAKIQQQIKPGTLIYSDEASQYKNIDKYGYPHAAVAHSKYEFVRDNVHSNNIENVWSHLKRGIEGVYRQVSPKYLQDYANEFAWRYNNRFNPNEMFDSLLSQI